MTRPDADSLVPLSPEEVKRAVRQFSHEVMQPLQAMHALSRVLMEEVPADSRLHQDLRAIHEAAEQTYALVRQLAEEVTHGRKKDDSPTGS